MPAMRAACWGLGNGGGEVLGGAASAEWFAAPVYPRTYTSPWVGVNEELLE